MSVSRDRARIFVGGLGTFALREKEPSVETAFQDCGWLDSTEINLTSEMEEIIPETGSVADFLERSTKHSGSALWLQTGGDEVTFVRASSAKVYSARYYGRLRPTQKWQYFCFDSVKLNPSVALKFQGKRVMPVGFMALKDHSLSYDVPETFLVEVDAPLFIDKCVLWLCPRIGLNSETAMVLDVSGFGRHGTLSSGFADIWQQTTTPAEFLRLDGSDDTVDCGNVCNFTNEDFGIEFWLRVPAANGTAQEILAKKSASGTSAGFSAVRTAGNTVSFEISDGTDNPDIATTGTILQNVWKHVALVVDRSGNAQTYLNGAADGSPVDVSAVGDMTNALSLVFGKLSTGYGQVDIGDPRIHNYGLSGLPSGVAAQILSHYTAERAKHGV